jgi:NAD+ synthase (glutamine-hydrolysing)
VRALLAAIQCEKGEVEKNLAAHLRILTDAAAAGCDLALFPEMSLSGSVDLPTHPERLIRLEHPAIRELARATGETGVAACFGIGELAPDGKRYITQIFAAYGMVVGVQRKRHTGEGEERYDLGTGDAIFECAGVRLGVAICAESGYDQPFDAAAAGGAQLMLFPAAPGLYGPRRNDEASWRDGFSWWEGSSLGDARRHASRLGLWIASAGQAGATVDEDFPGLAALVNPDGEVIQRLADWREGTLIVDIPLGDATAELAS